MKKILSLSIFCILLSLGYAQSTTTTIGLGWNTEASYNGYTLFSPFSSDNTYLIDNCGYVINEWACTDQPDYHAHLMDDGSIVRMTDYYMEIRDWDNTLTWQYVFGGEYDLTHSDMHVMPNGNIAMIVEYYLTNAEFEAMGGIPNPSGNYGASLEGIVELEPTGFDSFNVVWEWWADDHFIQDNDPTKPKYGVVADHPELLDMNHPQMISINLASEMHFNSVQYNEELDLMMVSNLTASEIFIFDRSTTTAEAAGSTGGNYGKGGDYLFRWGNPENYDHGTAADRFFFGQHCAHWIPSDYENGGMISVHENGNGRPGGEYSRAVIINPNLENGEYEKAADGTYLPEDLYWSWDGDVNGDLYFSRYYSGVHAQPNGNMLICEGQTGRFFEVDSTGNVVWFYQNPVSNFIFDQGDNPGATGNYRSPRYRPEHPAFADKDMTPGNILENMNINSDACIIYENPIDTMMNDTTVNDTTMMDTTMTFVPQILDEFGVYPNPFKDYITIQGGLSPARFSIHDMNGQLYMEANIEFGQQIYLGEIVKGVYILSLFDTNDTLLDREKIIKID